MNIAITGGGTGGHLTIAKALGEECKKQGITTLYIGGTKGQDKQWFNNENAPFNHIVFLDSTPVVNQSFLGKWSALAKNIAESLKAKQLLQKHNIDACISVGGFSAATGSFGAIFNKIPFFIHEQNARIGSLNKLLKPFAKNFFSSFEYPYATITPYPVNNDFFIQQRERASLGIIAFFGGSQGAKAINEIAIKLAPLLKKQGIKILHQTGKIDYENIYKAYITQHFHVADSVQDFKNNNKDVFVFDFSIQMAEIMNMADFCISRAGASSLWELVSNGLPTLFIPYPYSAKNHQYFNAKSLIDKQLALLYTQEELLHIDANDLMNEILKFDLAKISKLLIQTTKQNGAEYIINTIKQYFEKR